MIEMILAMNLNGTIGDKGKLVWNSINDMKWFLRRTENKKLVCGRKTYESLPNSLKNNRDIRVITNSKNPYWDDLYISMIDVISGLDNYSIIGGGEIYKQLLPYTDMLYLTIIPEVFYGDTTFEINWNEWEVGYTESYDDALCMILDRVVPK